MSRRCNLSFGKRKLDFDFNTISLSERERDPGPRPRCTWLTHVQPVPEQNASVSKFRTKNTESGWARAYLENFELWRKILASRASRIFDLNFFPFEPEPPPPREEPHPSARRPDWISGRANCEKFRDFSPPFPSHSLVFWCDSRFSFFALVKL
jgi:hypothetical protein